MADLKHPPKKEVSDRQVGRSKPAIIRKQVVLPEPEGPSIEKNSPSVISSITLSTALSSPKCRLTCLKRIAESLITYLQLEFPGAPEFRRAWNFIIYLLPDYRSESLDPLIIGHTIGLTVATVRNRRLPKSDLVKIVVPVGLAAIGTQQSRWRCNQPGPPGWNRTRRPHLPGLSGSMECSSHR